MRAAARAGVVVALLLVTGCSSAKSEPPIEGERTGGGPNPVPGRSTAATPCSASARDLPSWAAAYSSFNGDKVVSDQNRAVGVLFTPPLRSPKSEDNTNKILWVVDSSRNDQPLRISGRQVGTSKSFRVTQAANAEPGNVYPTVVDAPDAGCWHLTLSWGASTDTIDLPFIA